MESLDCDQELQEISQTLPQMPAGMNTEEPFSKLPRQLAALRHRNYRLFFFGQLISLVGTWIQSVALAWLVLQLTNKALLLGVSGAISALPFLLFSLPAGLVADRVSKRNLLVVTQTCMMLLALALALATHLKFVNIYYVFATGFLMGIANAFDAPTRQAFVVEMVGREDLPNAIAVNSAMFNGARMFGPAIAGAILAAFGTAGAFFINGLSFIPVIVGLALMRLSFEKTQAPVPHWQSLKDGLAYVRGNKMVKGLLMMTGVVSIFSMSYAVLMPIFARDILHVGARGFGYLMSMVGLGALGGAITISQLGDIRWKGKLLIVGNLCFCTMLTLFTFSRILPLSLALLLPAGWGIMLNMAMTNTLIQTTVPDHLRGRVMSFYTLMFLGMAPIGSLQSGVLAHWLGAPNAIRIGTAVCALAAVGLGATHGVWKTRQ
jgi:MFS family permease